MGPDLQKLLFVDKQKREKVTQSCSMHTIVICCCVFAVVLYATKCQALSMSATQV